MMFHEDQTKIFKGADYTTDKHCGKDRDYVHMPPRTSYLEDANCASAEGGTRPMVIPRSSTNILADDPTSVTEETISSSHSSESLGNADETLSGIESQGSSLNSNHTNLSKASSINLAPGGPISRARPSFTRYGSSYPRGSFVGRNGSYISTSFDDDTVDGSKEEDGDGALIDHEGHDNEHITKIRPINESAIEDEETERIPRPTEPIAIAQPMVRNLSSKYFEESLKGDDYLQQFTPYHNTPTSVSNSYSNNPISLPSAPSNISPVPLDEQDPQAKEEEDAKLLELAQFPTDRLLQMLTALLNQIVSSNDQLRQDKPAEPEKDSASKYRSEVLSFRGKHVPAITLEQYFQRIQKYCPTTNDVFLSLLVYFDRIAKACNHDMDQMFVMDSYNIHRLIIAAVTVSTKFFSDFFYSNSRYARVSGISLQELNYLELQFLVLCDFELIIGVEELQKYGDLLYEFWQRENSD